MTETVNAFALAAPPPAAVDGLSEQIADLSPSQRASAARQAEILGAIGQGLAGLSVSQRRSALDHIAPMLIAQGMPARSIADFDPTDRNLASVLSEAGTLRDLLAKTRPDPAPTAGAQKAGAGRRSVAPRLALG